MYKRIVVKLGTSVLTGGERHLNQRAWWISRQCAALPRAARRRALFLRRYKLLAVPISFPQLPPTIVSKQLFAAVGQLQLMRLWNAFSQSIICA